jgi:hypothetical protein
MEPALRSLSKRRPNACGGFAPPRRRVSLLFLLLQNVHSIQSALSCLFCVCMCGTLISERCCSFFVASTLALQLARCVAQGLCSIAELLDGVGALRVHPMQSASSPRVLPLLRS